MSREIKSNSKQHIFIYIFYKKEMKKEKKQHLKQNEKNLRVLQKKNLYIHLIYILLNIHTYIQIKHVYTHIA